MRLQSPTWLISLPNVVGAKAERRDNKLCKQRPRDKVLADSLNRMPEPIVDGLPGKENYDLGTGFGHFAIGVEDAYKTVESIKAAGKPLVTDLPSDPNQNPCLARRSPVDNYSVYHPFRSQP